MKRQSCTIWIALCTGLALSGSSRGDVIAIGPFTGMAADTFNQYNNTMAEQVLPVFGGLGVIRNMTQGGAIKVEWGSQFSGKWVYPRSGMMMGQLGIGQWEFDVPVTRFGGWWENNSGVSDATIAFYDAQDLLLGERNATIPFQQSGWTWNGWESDVPIHRIVVTGRGVLNGFLWYEDMQIDYVPTPGSLLVLAGIGAAAARRRSRCS
ncbi:MAG: hypothetical protein IT430_11880 [Phycisphaerales bacterium]|nr:hypothetical protein [Phycisphaerales bacterium]